MADFLPCSASLRAAPPEPHKHVNYDQGMVLGVDDYTQEFAYLAGRLQWLTRDLVGYGVVHGLNVSHAGAQLIVTAGVAITPRGQLVCVPLAQTADLNTWLRRRRREVDSALSSPPSDELTLYLTLKYRERLTDDEPVPGRPCRDEEPPLLPSRVQDDFLLELHFQPPDQDEEDAVRDFVAWLRQIQVTTIPGEGTPLSDFLIALRQAAQLPSSPPGSLPSPPESPPDDYLYGSPPPGLRVPEAELCEYLGAAFRLWVSELRSLWARRSEACIGTLPSEERVLLATLSVKVSADSHGQWMVVSIDQLDTNRSPYLVHTRLLQEWLLCGWHPPLVEPGTNITPETSFGLPVEPGSSPRFAREDHSHGTPSLPPIPSPAQTVVAERSYGLPEVIGQSARFAREDHSHGTPPLPAIPAPAESVVEERSYDLPPIIGTLPRFARADHSHGTPPPPPPSPLIAAGRFRFDGTPEFSFGDLTALHSTRDNRLYLLRSRELQLIPSEIVKGTPINLPERVPATFEVLELKDEELQTIFEINPADPNQRGIVVRVSTVDTEPTQMGFMVEISRYG